MLTCGPFAQGRVGLTLAAQRAGGREHAVLGVTQQPAGSGHLDGGLVRPSSRSSDSGHLAEEELEDRRICVLGSGASASLEQFNEHFGDGVRTRGKKG